MHSTRPAHLILLHLLALTAFGEQHETRSSSLRYFLHPPVPPPPQAQTSTSHPVLGHPHCVLLTPCPRSPPLCSPHILSSVTPTVFSSHPASVTPTVFSSHPVLGHPHCVLLTPCPRSPPLCSPHSLIICKSIIPSACTHARTHTYTQPIIQVQIVPL
jgi:hypothetical protein